jgi:hypothetical protein
MSEIIEEVDEHSSAISVSAWDRKKQRSFIICGKYSLNRLNYVLQEACYLQP